MVKKKKKVKSLKVVDPQTGLPSIYAYAITDPCFGEFKVLKSANAWWLDKAKLTNFISIFKIDGTIREACSFAGISVDQWGYFKENHPEFSHVEAACRELPGLKARKTVVDSLDNTEHAKWYLTKKRKAEFADSVPGVAVQINVDNVRSEYEN